MAVVAASYFVLAKAGLRLGIRRRQVRFDIEQGGAVQAVEIAHGEPIRCGEAIEGADAKLAAKLFEITHGNPLFVDEMLRDVKRRRQTLELRHPLAPKLI